MCRLLGIIANKPVDLEFSLGVFKEKFAAQNPDGWGIGWYKDGEAKIEKNCYSASKNGKFSNYSKHVTSKIIIAHVRRGTGAKPAKENSHPFKCKNWIFAHNGSVDREYLLKSLTLEYGGNKIKLKGETDSEVYFYWLLQCIEKNKNVALGIKEAVNNIIKSNYTGLNFLLSDGASLYAFRYSNTSRNYYSLFKLERDPSSKELAQYVSKETKALITSKSLNGEKAVLLCSEKLTDDEDWKEINFGTLLIINSNLTIKEVKII
ncbi:MAG: class II glutamine amidotransferase [Candidatus Anstonellales archaeon]